MAFGHLEGPSGPLDSCNKKLPPFFYRAPPPIPPPPAAAPLPLAQRFFLPPFFLEYIYFYRGPPLYPPAAAPPYPLHRVLKKKVAILDFTDVKHVTEGREGKEGTRLNFLCELYVLYSQNLNFTISILFHTSSYRSINISI